MTVGESKKEAVQTSDENGASSIACLQEKVLHISNELDQFSWMFGHFSAIEERTKVMIWEVWTMSSRTDLGGQPRCSSQTTVLDWLVCFSDGKERKKERKWEKNIENIQSTCAWWRSDDLVIGEWIGSFGADQSDGEWCIFEFITDFLWTDILEQRINDKCPPMLGSVTHWLHFIFSKKKSNDGHMLIIDHRPEVADGWAEWILTDE